MWSWDEPGGDPPTGPVASGVKRARARSRLSRGTGETVVLESRAGMHGVEGVPQAAEAGEAEYRPRARGRTVS